MGMVAVSNSASRLPVGVPAVRRSPPVHRQLSYIEFNPNRQSTAKCSALATTSPAATPSPDTIKQSKKSRARTNKQSENSKIVDTTKDLDYNEVAAALESIYKLSPAEVAGEESTENRRKAEKGKGGIGNVVRNSSRRLKRLSLEKRINLKQKLRSQKNEEDEDKEKLERLVKEYSSSTTELTSFDWKKMKIPPVLSSAEHQWLFKTMQPMKAVLEVKENLCKDLGREATEVELATAVSMSVPELRRCIEVGRAAKNKLIKHNLRLVLFVMKKYFPEFSSGQKFQDLCQAGVKGFMTAIDRFKLKRGSRLSTYALFWIRHSIIRSMTTSSFTKVPFGIESVKQEIRKAKLELSFELGRLPTEEEIIQRVGMSPERYNDIMKASDIVYSLNARHAVTQKEFIDGVADIDGVGGDKYRQPALLRLALDDVLDSLKPKESLVIRQRYGLDRRGDRTLSEIAGNLNISREMVRKYEAKALLKLKHPARVDYIRRYI